NAEFNTALKNMINSAGEMTIGNGSLPDVPDSLNNNLDRNWINNTVFSTEISNILHDITEKFRPQESVYFGESWPGGPPEFEKDKLYHFGESYPVEEKRLLALFRYWNIINYFFPYKDIMDNDWDEVLMEFIPKIVEASDDTSYHLNFKEFTTHIDDSHSFFNSSTFWEWNGQAYPPFQLRFIENETVVTQVLEGKSSVKVGDVVKEIDGYDIYDLRDNLRRYAEGSNDVIIERSINSLISYGNFGSSIITVDDGTQIKTKGFERNYSNYSDLREADRTKWRVINGKNSCKVGVINMGLLENSDLQQMFIDLWDTDAIIFDIRNYPNGTLWNIVNYLFPDPIPIANFTTPDYSYPGRLFWHKEYIGSGTSFPYAGKVLILFDERTQSQAEYTVMGLEQFPDAIKVGSTTSGADGNIMKIYLPGKIIAYATFLGVFYPDYTPTQRVGIIPDVEVHPTILGIRDGEDEVLNTALKIIDCEPSLITHIDEEEMNKNILFPNPVGNTLNYELTQKLNGKDIIFLIRDTQGRNLQTITKNTYSGEIDLSKLNSGMYFVKIMTDNFNQSKIIIKK
ncbi:T9SS type A sorting domain-containing protein, partial [Xanthovirga aplysinae]|uniref:T9SS type A sorting domain-containing protein n=1 Tax=Xanthovirga aplysinae TaxID=2529853 RepID=UPI001657100A